MTAPLTGTDALLAAVTRGVDVLDLGQPLANGMPCSPNHPGFRMALARRHGDMVRADGGSSANEVIVTGGHVGTHIDALAHVSHDGRLHGGHDAAQAQTGGGFSALGVETIDPMVCRGVLLDVADLHGLPCLPEGYGISAADLEAAGTPPRAGDVCLIRTGWSRWWSDPERYLGFGSGAPGVTPEAAEWLAARKVHAAGADTTAFEHIPAGRGHAVMPVHRILLVDHGIYIIENMRFDELASRRAREFAFVLSPLRIAGATGSPVRPLALIGR